MKSKVYDTIEIIYDIHVFNLKKYAGIQGYVFDEIESLKMKRHLLI